MTTRIRIVLLSPHPDDAVWSLGGAIRAWQQQHDVLVVTMCDGDPDASATEQVRQEHHRWRSFGDMATRRLEDRQAMDLLGCELHSLGYRDAALRLSPANTFEYPEAEALFLQPEAARQQQVSAEMTQRLQMILHPDDQVIAPLGFGGHVDHCLTHALARHLPQTVAYYAEFPYYHPNQIPELSSHVAALGLTLTPVDLACDWHTWAEASLRYRSQVVRLFRTRARFLDALSAYAGATAPCCRIWSTRRI